MGCLVLTDFLLVYSRWVVLLPVLLLFLSCVRYVLVRVCGPSYALLVIVYRSVSGGLFVRSLDTSDRGVVRCDCYGVCLTGRGCYVLIADKSLGVWLFRRQGVHWSWRVSV